MSTAETSEDRWMAARHAATTAHMIAQLVAMGRTDLLPADLRLLQN
jgi:hypothetical protein